MLRHLAPPSPSSIADPQPFIEVEKKKPNRTRPRPAEDQDMAKTVADQLAETLAAVGLKRIYGIVGDSLNGITDAVRRQGKIEWLHVRHEEVAAFAAGAEAHLTGELAVCAGSCGPGNLH